MGDDSMTNLLFLCARNRLRSPTAERIFASRPGVGDHVTALATRSETIEAASFNVCRCSSSK